MLNRILWLVSDRTTLHGYAVGYAVDAPELSIARARLEAALGLLETVRPRWLRRMRSYVARIQVRQIIHSIGTWDQRSRQVNLDQRYLCRADVSTVAVASALVHEFTHARIDASGVRYTAAKRVRIEQACVVQELAFVRALGGNAEHQVFLDKLQWKWDHADEVWSDEAGEHRWRAAVQSIGTPAWVISGFVRLRQLRKRLRAAA